MIGGGSVAESEQDFPSCLWWSIRVADFIMAESSLLAGQVSKDLTKLIQRYHSNYAVRERLLIITNIIIMIGHKR